MMSSSREQGAGAGRIGRLEPLFGSQDGPAPLTVGLGQRREGDGELGKVPGRVAGPAVRSHPGGGLHFARYRLVRATRSEGQVTGSRPGGAHHSGQPTVDGAAIGCGRLVSDH